MKESSSRSGSAASAALRADRNRFLAFAFAWPEVLLELDVNDRIVYATGALDAVLGRDSKALVGIPFVDLVVPSHRGLAVNLLSTIDRQCRTDQTVLFVQGPDGASVPLACAGHRLPELGGHTFLGLRTAQGVTKVADHQLRDPATGLHDSKSFVESVCRQFTSALGRDALRLSLIRVPGLEPAPGDSVDDDLLRGIADRIRESSSDGDLAARFGPDRFGLVHEADLDLATLQNELAQLLPAKAGTQASGIETTSLSLESGAMRTEEIAKGVVYIINRFRSASGSTAAALGPATSFADLAAEATRTIDGLKAIISAGSYEVVFQPIIDTFRGTIHHYEALTRFPRGTGLKNTFEHISLAEEIGLIDTFDIGMARKVIEWLRTSRATSGAKCALNLSGQSVMSEGLSAKLHQLLLENRWLRGRLSFEITESSRMHDLAAANRFVLRLRELGYIVCLDDFGAGAANFGYLSSLDVDIVKFDGPAMQSARKTPKGLAFLKALVGVCRDLNIRTVFEMVDDTATLGFARSCRVDYVQGYLFGKPHTDVSVFPDQIPGRLFGALEAL